ncbi:Dimethyladenosine transferase [Tulasnella sp. 419]|nr:Dimethyladenosine transferase [Tulasnella sp. 419]
MPRATTERFLRVHDTSVKRASSSRSGNNASEAESHNPGRNPLFNTEKFGQHILKNPLVAQGIVDKVLMIVELFYWDII